MNQPHFVLARKNKRPVIKNWQNTPKSADEAKEWVEQGKGLAGIMPGSMNLAVIDVDEGGQEGCDYIIEHLGLGLNCTIMETNRGHHIYILVDENHRKFKFEFENGVSGDYLGSTGYAVIHCPFEVWATRIDYMFNECDTIPFKTIREKLPKQVQNGHSNNGKIKIDGEPIERIKNAVKGSRNHILYGVARDIHLLRQDPWELVEICAQHHPDMTTEEVEKTIQSAIDKNEENFGEDLKGLDKASEIYAKLNAKREEGPPTEVELNKEGFIEAMTELKYEIRQDYLTRMYQVFHPEHRWANGWISMDDEYKAFIQCQLESKFIYINAAGNERPYDLSEEKWKRYLKASMFSRRVNSFHEDFLKALPQWDGRSRIEYAFIECFGAEDTPLNRQMAKLLFLAIVARNTQNFLGESGVKFDLMIILQGREGNGKSTFCEELCGKKYHDDGIALNSNPQRQAESIQGKVIIEVSELSGLKKADIDKYKAQITRRVEPNVRMAFKENPVTHPRFCVFIGTSNPSDVIPDTGGENRRWVVVHVPDSCSKKKVEDYLKKNRDQLFAEAMHVWERDKPALILDNDAQKIQTESNREHLTGSDDYRELVADKLSYVGNPFRLIDLAKELCRNEHHEKPTDLDADTYMKSNMSRLKKAVQFHGYKNGRYKIDGSRHRGWKRE